MSNCVKKAILPQAIDYKLLIIAGKRISSQLHHIAKTRVARWAHFAIFRAFVFKTSNKLTKTTRSVWMKNYWIVLIVGLLSLGVSAQTGAGAGGAASGSTSVSAGQSGANANANADANAKADAKHGSKQANGSASGSGNGSAGGSATEPAPS